MCDINYFKMVSIGWGNGREAGVGGLFHFFIVCMVMSGSGVMLEKMG